MRQATGYSTRGNNLARPSRKEVDDRPSALRKGLPLRPSTDMGSQTGVAAHSAIYFQCADVAENEVDHLIPRRSYSHSHHLASFPQSIETEEMKGRQLDHCKDSPTFGQMVEVSYNRLVRKSDRTLLRTDKPEAHIGENFGVGYGFKRQTSRSKRIIREIEQEPERIK